MTSLKGDNLKKQFFYLILLYAKTFSELINRHQGNKSGRTNHNAFNLGIPRTLKPNFLSSLQDHCDLCLR